MKNPFNFTISIRNKLILSVALVHLVLMGIFVADTFHNQRKFLLQETYMGAVNFSGLMAENILSWVLAEDLMGMDEVLQASAHITKAQYACVIDPAGQVLAHTSKDKVGMFLSDAESLALLHGTRRTPHIWRDDPACLHAAAPLLIQDKCVGWVLLGMDLKEVAAHLAELRNTGLFYTVIAILSGAFAAWMLACFMFRQVSSILEGIQRHRNNDFSTPIPILANDELGHMAQALNTASVFLQNHRNALEREVQEHMKAEQRVRHLTRQLVDANEDERKRLGHDLHDEMGQRVTGLLFALHALKTSLDKDNTEALTLCEQMNEEFRSFGKHIRRVSYGQYPVILERLGLAAEAQAFLKEISERHENLRIDYEIELPKERLHPRVEVTCYRILQEAMGNILRHSGANRVRVQLCTMEKWVYLKIADNGKGFDTSKITDNLTELSGIGIAGMQARVLALDGDIEFDSRPGGGCVIEAFIPLQLRDNN